MPLNEELMQTIFSFLLLSPEQQLTLKLLSKKWKAFIDEKPYFFDLNMELPDTLRHIAMAMAPVNSSGDIYHMLAAVILTANLGHKIPPILLAHDETEQSIKNTKKSETNTLDQVNRACAFTSDMGYGNCFFKLRTIRNKTSHATTRQKQLEVKLLASDISHYLDGRLATSLIANHVRLKGLDDTTRVLRKGLAQALATLPEEQKQFIDDFVNTHWTEIQATYNQNQRPIVAIHYRYSGKANKGDLSSIAPDMVTALIALNYDVIAIYADPRNTPAELKNVITHIYPFQRQIHETKDLAKLCHLALLLKLYDKKNNIELKGLIGNTSGTLDLAAFMGHKVFNIHKFKDHKYGYQDWRLLMQQFFMSIENINNFNFVTNTNSKLLFSNLEAWLNNNQQPAQLPGYWLTAKKANAGMEAKGLKLFNSIGVEDNKAYRRDSIDKMLELEEEVKNQCVQLNWLKPK